MDIKKSEIPALTIIVLFIIGLLYMAISMLGCSNGLAPGILDNETTGTVIGGDQDEQDKNIIEGDENNEGTDDTNGNETSDNPAYEETGSDGETPEEETETGEWTNEETETESGDGTDTVPDNSLPNTDTGINETEGSDIPILFTTVEEVNGYLSRHSVNKKENPIFLSLQIDFDIMGIGTSWQLFMNVLKTQGKYVSLDLSRCSFIGAEFNPLLIPNNNGKFFITSIIIPDTTEKIKAGSRDTYTFNSFDNLQAVTLPDTIISIGSYAFYNRSTLVKLVLNSTAPPELGANALSKTNPALTIYVPPGSLVLYKNAEGWKEYSNQIVPK